MNMTEETIDIRRYLVKRSSSESSDSKILDFCQLFRLYSSIILVIVGMIGSMLSIKVFSSTKIRRNSSNEYLITMSFVVALLLFNYFCDEVLRSIVRVHDVKLPINLVDLSGPLCKCSTYLRHTLRFAAHWIVVAFTLERLIVVYFPLQTSVLCNPRSARRICLFILIISFLLPFYSFLMSNVNSDEKNELSECDIMNEYKAIYFYLTIIYGNLTLTFPILIVSIVNILTVRQLLRAGRLRKKQQQQQQLSQTKKVDSANNEYVNMIMKNQLENDKVTWMLVVISITFGILNFPYFILWLVTCIMRVRGDTPPIYVEAGRMIAEVFYLLNYSLYFFLYVISRRTFRKVLIEKMRWRCDWFEQWRLYEMRVDAAIRSQQMSRQETVRKESTVLEHRTSMTNLRPSSSRRLLTAETEQNEELTTSNTNIASHMITSERTSGIYSYDFGNTFSAICILAYISKTNRFDADDYSESAFFTSFSEQFHHKKSSIQKLTTCSQNEVICFSKNNPLNFSRKKIHENVLPFYLLPAKVITNRNAIHSVATKKLHGLDPSNQIAQAQSTNLILIERKQLQSITESVTNIEFSPNDLKSSVKSAYHIPSPTILLPGELSPSPKSIINSNTVVNKLQRSTPTESNRNLMIFNQPTPSFHRQNRSIDHIDADKISLSSINVANLNQPISPSQISLLNTTIVSPHDEFNLHKSNHLSVSVSPHVFPIKQVAVVVPRFVDKPSLSNRSLYSPRISLSQMINDLDEIYQSNPASTLSQDFESLPLKSYHESTSQFEMTPDIPLYDPSPQVKTHSEIKYQPESLWKMKFTLKTLLSMANRDDAQALKDRKPIDYHMFLTNKFNKNSIFHYTDLKDGKSTTHVKTQSNEQNAKENRKLYRRLLGTMSLRKPVNIKKVESVTSLKKIKTKRVRSTKRSIPQTSVESSISHPKNTRNEQPVLINYQIVPISSLSR
ncbi:unnamed protein product [Adineta ricciae]|uniref:G-protein coupled receptors family 1 profile domain-containing protein n=1 Tax=Adineta ricciae TaxID=249248 RepID=A0A813NEK6_ADIRI|nr:unnamed protein product [Adineta ricciae]